MNQQLKIFPLSDSALTAQFSEEIDEKTNQFIVDFYNFYFKNLPFGIIELVPAFASITVFYDVFRIRNSDGNIKSAFGFVKNWLESEIEKFKISQPNSQLVSPSIIEIPVKYNGEDLNYVANFHGISIEALIEIHTKPLYKVFMMGFLPGFAYLGGMDEIIATPRKASPRLTVPAGSVGIAGKQTGIYPIESPGGWQLIGKTELELFTPQKKSQTLLKTGDFIRFLAV